MAATSKNSQELWNAAFALMNTDKKDLGDRSDREIEDEVLSSITKLANLGWVDRAKGLFRYGINHNEQWMCGNLLTTACYRKFLRVADFLLDQGADVNNKNSIGEAPLDCVVMNTYDDDTAIKLVRCGATFNKLCSTTTLSVYRMAEKKGMKRFCEYLETKPNLVKDIQLDFSGPYTVV